MIRVSSKPRVVIRPTRVPVRWISALAETVVPWPKRAVSDSGPRGSVASRAARRRRTSSTASSGASGVENDFSKSSRPAPSMRTRSVNVPPVSMPMP
jgi:hypothetical protein